MAKYTKRFRRVQPFQGVADVMGGGYIIVFEEICAIMDPKNHSILIVEDEAELRSLFAILLEMEGFTVFQASDGLKGLELLQTHASQVTMMITDLNLPQVGGIDLISRARALNSTIKIVGTSGMSGKAVQDMVIKAGADEFLAKPFQPAEAIAKLKAILQ
jgi:DNA-binding response OmpR family regulator